MLTGVQGTTLDIYVNGELNNSLNSNLNIATNNVWIGAWQSGARFLNGQVSNTQIYPKALTTTEIKQNYFQSNIVQDGLVFMVDANNLVSYPKSGTTSYSLTGSATATLGNGTGFNSRDGGTWVFDGVDDYISLTNPINSAGPYSVIQWVRASTPLVDTFATTGADRRTPLVGPGPVWSPGYWLTARTFRVHAATEYRDLSINLVGDTGWHQIGQIYDGTTCYHILDGAIYLGTRTSYSSGAPSTILLGAETTGGSSVNWIGDIATTTFYSKVLTAAEVLQNYNATK
jgi:hypothetical protein